MRLSGCFSQKNANAKRLKMMFPKQQKTFFILCALTCKITEARPAPGVAHTTPVEEQQSA